MKYLSCMLFLYTVFLNIPNAYADFDKESMSIDVTKYPSSVGEDYTAALEGDLQAQYNLGAFLLITDPKFVGKDEFKKGIKWWVEAAQNGHKGAQHQLSRTYSFGLYRVSKDLDKAIKWGLLAANGAQPERQWSLGNLYITASKAGELDAHGYNEAIRWFKEAAKQGHKRSFKMLSSIYENGWDGKKYPFKAYMFFILSIEDNEKPHPYRLHLLTKNLSNYQINDAKKEAKNWLAVNPIKQIR